MENAMRTRISRRTATAGECLKASALNVSQLRCYRWVRAHHPFSVRVLSLALTISDRERGKRDRLLNTARADQKRISEWVVQVKVWFCVERSCIALLPYNQHKIFQLQNWSENIFFPPLWLRGRQSTRRHMREASGGIWFQATRGGSSGEGLNHFTISRQHIC